MSKSRKGGEWEREFCRILTEWWLGDSERDVCFWRTSQSGGRATSRRKKGKVGNTHCGDISSTDAIAEPLTKLITFELKNGYKASAGLLIHDLLDMPSTAEPINGELGKWVRQATEASKNAGTPYWMIVYKRDRREPVIFMEVGLWGDLWDDENQWDGTIPNVLFRFDAGDDQPVELFGMRLSGFLENVTPNHVRRRYEEWRQG